MTKNKVPKITSEEAKRTNELALLDYAELKAKREDAESNVERLESIKKGLNKRAKRQGALVSSYERMSGNDAFDGERFKAEQEKYNKLVSELSVAVKDLDVANKECSAISRAFLKKEVDEYREIANRHFKKYLNLTNVKRVEDEGAFVFVSKKQLLGFWDKKSHYDGEVFGLYGLIDICDIHEDDIKDASIISDGKNFYRGIKHDYASDVYDYWAVDYSDVSLGKYVKSISTFAVNLRVFLKGLNAKKTSIRYQNALILLRKLILTIPTSVGVLPYYVFFDKDVLHEIEEAIDKVGERLLKIIEENSIAGKNNLGYDEATNFVAKLDEMYSNRLSEAKKKMFAPKGDF